MTAPSAPRVRASREAELAEWRKPTPPQVSERKCLCCPRIFPSEGAHNRMCDPCRQGARRADANLPDARVSR